MKWPSATYTPVDVLWLLGVAVISSAWCVTATGELSATFDEPLYLTAGLERWHTDSYAALMKMGTMPLATDVQTFPLVMWERWPGNAFDANEDLAVMLRWARAGTLVFWWILLGYGWLAGRALGGCWAGRLAVTLLACEPLLLGHTALATTDIPLTACVLAFVYHFRTGREASWSRRVALPMFWFAAAVLAKASGLAFGMICMAVLEIARLVPVVAVNRVDSRWRAWLAALRPFWSDAGQIVGGGLVVVFLYCGTDWRSQPSFVLWAQSLPEGRGQGAIAWIAEHLRIFSNAGEAIVRQIRHNVRGHAFGAYLLGNVRPAFWYYFPVALTIKLSAPLLAALAVLLVWRPRALLNWAILAAAALLLFSLTSRVQIGIRFVLPLVALLIVGLAGALVVAGRQTAPGWRRTALVIGVSVGCVWTAAASAAVWPHGIAYTNAIWGGTANGYRLLSDSNYDWGQGLEELRRWQRTHGTDTVDVWYFGGDRAVDAPPFRNLRLHTVSVRSDDELLALLHGRVIAASVSLLYGAPMNDDHRRAAAFLNGRAPIGRTTTFFIYDFTTR